MADDHDRRVEALLRLISLQYALLVQVCRRLPIPVLLPGDVNTPTALDAVWRAAELSGQQSLPLEQQRQLNLACSLWVVAADMHGLLSIDYKPWRVTAMVRTLNDGSSALTKLSNWLDQQRD